MSSLKKYRKLKYLGKGSYGAALLVELRADPSQKFVIKEIVIGHLKPAEQQAAKNEAEVLHQMNHSNITTYVESFVENSKLYIVMEFADGGDLSSAVQKRKAEHNPWTEEEVMRIFVQICLALRHVHNANILHRDLKSQNIFLTQKGMVKLGDFGIAKVLDASDDQARTQIGTPYYLSPEICESKPYGRKSDVWSLGVILYELLALEMPFQATSLPALVHRIVTTDPSYAKLEGNYSSDIVSLCRQLLAKNPDDRPSLSQVVRSDFIKGHISRLLSYTLKSGMGGVADGPHGRREAEHADDASFAGDLDADEAERRIEQARYQQRQQQASPPPFAGVPGAGNGSSASERERLARREEEREKLRKFRQENVQRRKEPTAPRAVSPNPNPFQRGAPRRPTSVSPPRQPAVRGAGVRPVSPSPSQPSQRGGGRSLAEVQAERARAVPVSIAVPPSNNAYESAARREFFANRAAALAVKAKVESYERGPLPNAGQGGGGGMSSAIALAGGPSRRPSDPSLDMDPETRIAQLRAQRERERDREIALKEQQFKQAIEANREERRRLEALKQAQAQGQGSDRVRAAVAFQIDVLPSPSLGAGGAQAKPIGGNRSASSSADAKSSDGGSGTGGSGGGSGKRRSWGPPVDGNDILAAKGLAPGPSEEEDVDGGSVGSNGSLLAGSEQVLRRMEVKRQSMLDMRNQARDVLSKLREQHLKERQSTGAARGTRGNRTQAGGAGRSVVAASNNARLAGGDPSPSTGGSRAVSPMRQRLMEIMQQVEMAKESVAKAMGNNEPSRRRGSRGAGGSGGSPPLPREGHRPREDAEEEEEEVEEELEHTLTAWLSKQRRGVTLRKKGFKQAAAEDEVEEDPALALYATDALDATEAVHRLPRYPPRAEEKKDERGDFSTMPRAYEDDDEFDKPLTTAGSERTESSAGEDVEVVGMQCMLAKALMDDDDEDR